MSTHKSKSTRQPAAQPAPQTPDAPDPPATEPQQRDILAHLPEAKALPAAEVRPMRADATLALRNVTLGLAAVASIMDRLRQELPALDWRRVDALPSLAMAVAYAAAQVNPAKGNNPRIQELLPRARKIRRRLLAAATDLVAAGLLPAREVELIRAGKGPLNGAIDCGQLAVLFRTHAPAIAGRTSITAAEIDEAEAIGNELPPLLKSRRARRDRGASGEVAQQMDLRDRLFTLLLLAYRELRRAALYEWPEDADARVPTLLSFNAPSRRRAKPPTPPASPDGAPNGAAPDGAVPTDATPNGAAPTSAAPNGAAPNGAAPAG